MKSNQRLEYSQLAKVMAERGMVEPQALQEALDICTKGGEAFPKALVNANMVADWELARVVCELYHLPFLTVDMCTPDPESFEGITEDYVRETGLIPLSRYGGVLTVCMPGMVAAETLGLLSAKLDVFILPVVGTVRTNSMWIEQNMAAPKPARTSEPAVSADWSDIFDAADAAVLLDLEEEVAGEGFEIEPADPDEPPAMPELGPAIKSDEQKPEDSGS